MSLLNLREMACSKLDQESLTVSELRSNQSFAVLFNLLQAAKRVTWSETA